MKSIITSKSFFAAAYVAASVTTALPAAARTVYDAGKALKANCTSGGYANPYSSKGMDTFGNAVDSRAVRSTALPWSASSRNTCRTERRSS